MNKHTPGPWFVADWTCFDGDNLLTIEAREPEITEAGQSGIWPDGIRKMKVACAADGSFNRSTNLANARLIAAAPEMADILREVAQLPSLLDGTNRSAVAITADLRQRIGEVLLKLNGFDEWPY